MATRKNSLQAVLEHQAAMKVAPEPEKTQALAKETRFHRPSREGRKLIAGHFDPKVSKQLKLLAAEEETTVQALLEEALDLVFVKKGKKPITRA